MNISAWPLLLTAISTLNNKSIEWSNSTSNELFLADKSIETLFLSLGGWSFFIATISALVSKMIFTRMSTRWTAEESKKLEKLRTDINHENSIYHKILDSYSTEFKFTQPNRVKAIEKLWGKVLEVRKLGTLTDTFYEIILEKEFDSIYENKTVMKLIEPLSDSDTFEKIDIIVKDVEKCRPFLGEYLWTLFRTYTRIIGRSAYILTKGRDENNIIMWYKDEFMNSILNEVFTEKEKSSICSMELGSFREATEILERKILYEISKTIFGELASENNFERASQIQQLLSKKESKENKYLEDLEG